MDAPLGLNHGKRGGKNRHSARMQRTTPEGLLVPVRSTGEDLYRGDVHDVTTDGGTFLLSNVLTHNCKSPYWDKPRGQKRGPKPRSL